MMQFRIFRSGILLLDHTMPKPPLPSPSVAAATQFVDAADQLKAHQHSIMLFVEGWKTYKQKAFDNAKWTTRIFRKETAKHIPEKPGVYAFLIRPGIPLGLDANVLIYIGKAGTSIRSRYYRYLKESIDPVHGRPKITYWLRKYFDYIHFAYAEIPKPGDPHDLEQRLLAALMPPANDQIPGRLRRKRHAFR
jgi:hypothetical protein